MRINVAKLQWVAVPKSYSFYEMNIDTEYVNEVGAEKMLARLYMQMKYDISDNISFMIGLSKQDGKTATKTTIKTGKKGRPKTIVKSACEKDVHLHIICVGEKVARYSIDKCRRINKKAGKTVAKAYKLKGEDKGANYIPYIYEQSERIMTYGSFDFKTLGNFLAHIYEV